jgi:hypothetical protein
MVPLSASGEGHMIYSITWQKNMRDRGHIVRKETKEQAEKDELTL